MFAGEKFPGPAKARLDLVEYEDDILFVAEMAQAPQVFLLATNIPASPCTGSIMMAAVSSVTALRLASSR